MPTSLRASVDALRNSEDARRWMGNVMHDHYIDMKTVEVNTWIHIPHEDRRRKFVRFF
jgi:glutamine synthetase